MLLGEEEPPHHPVNAHGRWIAVCDAEALMQGPDNWTRHNGTTGAPVDPKHNGVEAPEALADAKGQ